MNKTEKTVSDATELVDNILSILNKRLVEIRQGMPGSDKLPGDFEMVQDVLKRLDAVNLSTADLKGVFDNLYNLRRTLTLK